MDFMIAASKNQHKIAEMNAITQQLGLNIVPRDAAGIPDIEVEETGTTFEENSFLKADAIMKLSGKIAIADDSGLEVDALDGAPGVYSARFAGEDATDAMNNEKLLELLDGIPSEKRSARFVSVITVVYPDGRKIVARGECPGRILTQARGEGGFGYDPLFVPDGYEATFAEISSEEKNQISHRAKALAILKEQLKERVCN